MEIFTIENLSFTYPEEKLAALKSINLSITQGDFVVVFGESGSGKSTLLRMLKRELTPHGTKTGTIYYKQDQIEELDERLAASEIGFVMQNPDTQIVTDKVWHELAFGLENLGLATDLIRRRVGEIANFFGIHPWFHRKTTDLSGGQKQLLNLASVLVMQPDVLILDEPTAQLDPIASSQFIHTLESIHRDLGITIIIVEHRLEEVLPLADQVVLLEDGQILCSESPRKIGDCLKNLDKKHRMLTALPTAMRVYYGLGFQGESPLTIREGRRFLTERFHNRIKTLHREGESHSEGERIIELKNVWFRYERDLPDILAEVDLCIHEGEVVSILGGNGSGKSTLLAVMSGQLRAHRGSIKIKGKNIKKYKAKGLYRHLLAVLPQDPQTLFIKSTVYEDYQEIAKAINYSNEKTETLIDEIIALLGIENLLNRHPYDLSGGEQQLVALGKILLLQPKIVLLDEPTKGLDAFSKQRLLSIIKELKSQGLTIVIVTHDLEYAADVSDRCGLFFDRRILSVESPRRFFSTNNYYTTAASRMSRHLYNHTITYEDIIAICQENGEKQSCE